MLKLENAPGEVDDSHKYDTTGMVKGDKEIDGFVDGSEATKALYLTFIGLGLTILIVVYPLIFFNENKYKNLTRIYATIDDYLYVSKDSRTVKENENKLVFTQGELSFASPATDDLFGFQSPEAIVMHRNVEVYQWARVINYQFYDDPTQDRYKYGKIWSQ